MERLIDSNGKSHKVLSHSWQMTKNDGNTIIAQIDTFEIEAQKDTFINRDESIFIHKDGHLYKYDVLLCDIKVELQRKKIVIEITSKFQPERI